MWAQDFSFNFRLGPAPYSLILDQRFYQASKVDGAESMDVHWWRLRAGTPVVKNTGSDITVGIDASELQLSHPASPLKNYRNVQFNFGYRNFGRTNKMKIVSGSYGSASDKPFASARNNTSSLNYVQQVTEKWWVAVNWSNNRNFANNIPLPGAFYAAKMQADEMLFLGVPFIFWMKRYENGFNYQLVSFFPWNHQAEVGYAWKKWHNLLLGYEHRPLQFLRDQRDSDRDRLFFVEQRAFLGVRGAIIPFVLQWRFEAGRAFNRRAYEARAFSEQKKAFHFAIDDTNYASFELSSMF